MTLANKRWASLGALGLLSNLAACSALMRNDGASLQARQNTTDDGPDYYGLAPDNYTFCDYSKTWNTLDELSMATLPGPAGSLIDGIASILPAIPINVSTTMRPDCIAMYTLETLIIMLDTAYNNYTVVNDGYDQEFGYYIDYMKKLVPSVLDNSIMFNISATTKWMTLPQVGTGMSFFDCQIGSTPFPCADANTTDNERSMLGGTTTFTLRDAAGFNATLSQSGISPDWVIFDTHEIDHEFTAGTRTEKAKYILAGYPVENTNMDVPNPKDVITKGLGSIPDLRSEMQATLLDMQIGNWMNGSILDAAQA